MDLSNGKRWINVAAIHASGASKQLHDPSTHDHDYDTKHSTNAVESPTATADSTTGAAVDGQFQPSSGKRKIVITAAHNVTANEALSGSLAAAIADVKAAATHSANPKAALDQSDPEHDPHDAAAASAEVGPGGPKVANKALDDMIAHGLFHRSMYIVRTAQYHRRALSLMRIHH
jgi:hypothetical protein